MLRVMLKLDSLQVRIGFSIACFYIAVVVLIVQTVFRYVKPDRQAGPRSDSQMWRNARCR